MSKEYDIIYKNISNAQLLILHSKESLMQKKSDLSIQELENLIAEARELEQVSKSLHNQLISTKSY